MPLEAVAFYLYKSRKTEFGHTYPVVPGWHFCYPKKLDIKRDVNTTLHYNTVLVISWLFSFFLSRIWDNK
jgi:hypothetical protein